MVWKGWLGGESAQGGKAKMENEARTGYIISLSFHAEALSFGSSRERNECVTRPFREDKELKTTENVHSQNLYIHMVHSKLIIV